jgi:predicted dienelactone hydrolase
MRPWEALLAALVALAALCLFVSPALRYRWMHLLPSATLLLLAGHLLLEGYRWQTVPIYIVVVLLALLTAPNLRLIRAQQMTASARRARWPRLLGAILSLPIIALAVALTILFPHLRLPEPSGPYAVGTMNLNFVDEERPETFTPAPSDHRELFARIWYPARIPAGGRPVRYCENAHEISRALTGPTPMPSFLFDHLGLVKTHSFRAATMAGEGERFPVVIFSHAYWGSVSQCTALMEDLASHGYVAVSVGHSYETPYLIQADGHIRAFDPRNEEFRLRGVERAAAFKVEQRLTQTRDSNELETLVREISRLRPKTMESVRIWARDISSTIDQLERIDLGNGPLAGRLDLERIAVLGHSFGGAAAGQACLDDARCKAGINLDGLQLGDMLDRDLLRPFLFVHHDNAGATNKTPNLVFFERAKAPAYLLTIAGTGHLSFTDVSFYGKASFFRRMSPLGMIDGARCHRIVCDYLRAFLDRHLRGENGSLLDGPCSEYPEVAIRAGHH